MDIICYTRRTIGWMPILERRMNDKSWEYIHHRRESSIDNAHCAYGVPSIPSSIQNERVKQDDTGYD